MLLTNDLKQPVAFLCSKSGLFILKMELWYVGNQIPKLAHVFSKLQGVNIVDIILQISYPAPGAKYIFLYYINNAFNSPNHTP